jgi:hypothetical protein
MNADCSKMIGYDAKKRATKASLFISRSHFLNFVILTNGDRNFSYFYRDRIFKIPLSQLTAIAIFSISIAIAFFKFRYPN